MLNPAIASSPTTPSSPRFRVSITTHPTSNAQVMAETTSNQFAALMTTGSQAWETADTRGGRPSPNLVGPARSCGESACGRTADTAARLAVTFGVDQPRRAPTRLTSDV